MNINDFISSQLESWSEVSDRFSALDKCLTRTLDTGIRPITLQHNPSRVISTGAAVDDTSVSRRPCFLCRVNRPAVQRSISYGRYEILVNPFPIFPAHLTIAAVGHTPQRIAGRFADMLRLAEELHGHTVFYNGPRCGASAPDHFHFQAAPACFFPIIWALATSTPLASDRNVTLHNLSPACFAVADPTPENLTRLLEKLPADPATALPMVNILVWHDGCRLNAIVIPRSRHRPHCYGTAPGCRLVSPASVDLAGVFVIPRCNDFRELTAIEITGIINEVTYPASRLVNIITQ